MADCLFCKVASGQVSSRTIHADDEVVAFEDVNPQAPVHVLVIPRRHVRTLHELATIDASLAGRLMAAATQIGEERSASGYRVVANTGPNAGQSVDHVHIHVLGGRVLAWPPG